MKNIKDKISISTVANTLTALMSNENITGAELARRTNIPATTINRLLLEDAIDPRANTLKPLAKYFGVSIEQLMGDVPINPSTNNKNEWRTVPIIEWSDTIAWIFQHNGITPYSHSNWIVTEKNVGQKCFAIKTMPFMQPRFRNGSILIVDPDEQLQDGKYVVLTFDNITVTVRKAKIDGGTIYLENFDKRIQMEKYDSNKNRMLGVIIESRVNL